MTNFFNDLTFETPEQAAARAKAEFEVAECERRMVAELLAARGQRQAAAVVALSSLESVCVDNWDGGTRRTCRCRSRCTTGSRGIWLIRSPRPPRRVAVVAVGSVKIDHLRKILRNYLSPKRGSGVR